MTKSPLHRSTPTMDRDNDDTANDDLIALLVTEEEQAEYMAGETLDDEVLARHLSEEAEAAVAEEEEEREGRGRHPRRWRRRQRRGWNPSSNNHGRGVLRRRVQAEEVVVVLDLVSDDDATSEDAVGKGAVVEDADVEGAGTEEAGVDDAGDEDASTLEALAKLAVHSDVADAHVEAPAPVRMRKRSRRRLWWWFPNKCNNCTKHM